MRNLTIIAPGIVEMRDASNDTYLADEELSYILVNRRVWTDAKSGHLMIEEVKHHQKQCIIHCQLAVWWYRIMALNDLPGDLAIGFQDGNKRNLIYKNLVRLSKRSATFHDSNAPSLDPSNP